MVAFTQSLFRISLLLVCLATLESAHGRQFTDDQGRQVEAELAGVRGERAVLAVQQVKGLWPIARLSPADQAYVREWQKSHTSVQRVTVRADERDGMGDRGEFQDSSAPMDPSPAAPPFAPQRETRTSYRHYEIAIANPAGIDATYLRVAYVAYVIHPDGTVGFSPGAQNVQTLAAGQSTRITTEGVSATRTKTKRIKLSISNNSITTSEKNFRSNERFGGIWVRVTGPGGQLIGEHRRLAPELDKLNPAWQEAEVREDIPELKSISDLLELIKKALPPAPSTDTSRPGPPPFPPPPGR